MKPYYEHAGITIYHGDCREILPTLESPARPVTFDCVVTDPPYGDTSLEWDRLQRGWLDLVEPLTTNAWCFGSFRMFMEMCRLGETSRWTLAQEIVWEKQNGSGFHADRFKRVHELAVQWYRGDWSEVFKAPVVEKALEAKRIIRAKRPPHTGHIEKAAYSRERGGNCLMRSVVYAPNCHGYAEHPTQKPIEIIDPLLRYSTPIGGIVLDPFMGSGSVMVAAKALDFNAVGIDIDEKNCEIAAKRLSQEVLDFGASA